MRRATSWTLGIVLAGAVAGALPAAAREQGNAPVGLLDQILDVYVRDGYVYGLDGVLLQCIELETGKVEWKKRRRPSFGHGQLLLVGDVIMLLTESGELLAIEASPQRYHELAAVQVLDEANVTWNNPALAPPFLLVRNGREAACYKMPMK